MADETTLYFNGINAVTGDYELPPTSVENIASVALGQPVDEKLQAELKVRHDNAGPKYGINADTRNLAETGWGIIFAGKDQRTAAIREALKPLLDLRREQATRDNERFYQEYAGGDGYRPGDSHLDWLAREPRLMGPGSVDPDKVPYYLLLVGEPEQIPYRFQYQLDVQYAVGRLSFETLDEYAQYAQTVVAVESSKKIALPKRAAFFGVRNPDDTATQLSADNLVVPLASDLTAKRPDWATQTITNADASKARLAQFLGGQDTPALMFTASHGMAFPNGDANQLARQGALLCSDWPGPHDWHKAIPESFYLSAEDISSDARLAGLIAFFFACYGAGTPQFDDFARKALQQPESIAPRPFVARLPQRLLGHPKGSALAVVGHVERAWGYSFMWRDAGRQLRVFQDAFDQLTKGYPVGAALEWFNERHAELSVALASEVENVTEWQKTRDDARLAGLWTANNDARNYVVLGDPAVRLPVIEDGSQPTQDRTIVLSADTRAKLEEPVRAQPDTSAATLPSVAAPAGAASPRGSASFDVADFSFAVQGERSSLTDSIKNFTSQLAEALKKAAEDISSLEVVTFTSDNLKDVQEQKFAEGAGNMKPRALTRIAFDGDVQVCVPEKDGKVDEDLWNIHLSMVKAAQENRAAFLQTMAELATKLVGMLGGK